MLVKIDNFNKNNTWVNPAYVASIEVYDTEDDCRVYINMSNENGTLCSTTYTAYEEAVKAIDDIAEKINAAQGFKNVEYDEESKLMKAAEKIKAYCANRDGCIGCPFRGKDGMCLVDSVPSEWENI